MNAIKYAHPSGVMGNVLIGCNRAGDAIIVDVADDGVGFPEGFDPMTSGELGLQLVRSLANQLKAQLLFHDTGIGVHVTLAIPNVLQQGTQTLSTAAEFEFNAEEWQRLTPSERVRRCRSFAEQAKQLCADAPPDSKVGYLELSLHWLALADELEHHNSR